VSSVILQVDAGSTRVVLKRSLEKLRVEDEWHFSTARSITECEANLSASQLFPESVASSSVATAYKYAFCDTLYA
jgi:hypothetical protein